MFYKNSQNCEVQSIFFSYSGEPPASRAPILLAELEGAAGPAGTVFIN